MLGFSTDALLLAGDVIATLAVGVGIVLETPHNPDLRQKIAVGLVIVGVVVETLCSVGLFVHDEGVASSQRETIASQQKQIISLETQLLQVESRAELLRGHRQELIAAMKKYASQRVSLRLYDSFSRNFDTETFATFSQLEAVLNLAGWKDETGEALGRLRVNPPSEHSSGSGIVVEISPTATPATKAAAHSLWMALHALPTILFPEGRQIDKDIPADVIVVAVGTHVQ